jgi:hypothetical protein
MSHICPCTPCPSPPGYRSKVESRHFAHLCHEETKDGKREVHFPDAVALPPQGNGLIESLLLMETKEEKLDAPGPGLRSPSTTKKLIHSLSFILNTNRK